MKLILLSVSAVCQTVHRSRHVYCSADLCCAAKVFVPVPVKVSCTADTDRQTDTVAGLHGLDDQNSIPGGDRFPRPALARTSYAVYSLGYNPNSRETLLRFPVNARAFLFQYIETGCGANQGSGGKTTEA